MHPWDLPLYSTAPWTLPPTHAPQETPSPSDPTTTGRADAQRLLSSYTFCPQPCHPLGRGNRGSAGRNSSRFPTYSQAKSKREDMLGFRHSRRGHKQQRKLASLAVKPAQQLMMSWRRALKAIGQIEFRGERKAISS